MVLKTFISLLRNSIITIQQESVPSASFKIALLQFNWIIQPAAVIGNASEPLKNIQHSD